MTEQQIMTMSEVARALIRIENKLDEQISVVKEDSKDHEIRIRALERTVWAAIGAGGVGALTGVTGFITSLAGG